MSTSDKDPDFELSDPEIHKLVRVSRSSKKIKRPTKKSVKKSTKKQAKRKKLTKNVKKKSKAKNPELENLKKYWLPGQRHPTPRDGDPSMLFYTSLL